MSLDNDERISGAAVPNMRRREQERLFAAESDFHLAVSLVRVLKRLLDDVEAADFFDNLTPETSDEERIMLSNRDALNHELSLMAYQVNVAVEKLSLVENKLYSSQEQPIPAINDLLADAPISEAGNA